MTGQWVWVRVFQGVVVEGIGDEVGGEAPTHNAHAVFPAFWS